MDLDQIFVWILNHSINYPGKHQESQPRTNPAYKPVEPRAQFHIILKATAEYIKEKMIEAKGINIRNFGAFTFEVFSETVKPAQYSNFDITKDLNQQRSERKHIHTIRPCFIPDKQFKYTLARYPGKEEISAPKSQHSIYQQGFGMIFCNPGPIAQSCYLGKEVVTSALEAFVKAICDLTNLSYDLNINFGFLKLQVQDRNLKYQYKKDFSNQLNQTNFELKMRKSDKATSEHWTQSYEQKWATSSLNTLLKQPNIQEVKTNFQKTLALKIMSLDLNTTEQTTYSKNKLQTKLPAIQIQQQSQQQQKLE